MASRRNATHAGSWYSDKKSVLTGQLNGWLAAVSEKLSTARGVIAPHAGYRYSGPTAAYSYEQLKQSKAKRVFVLGPSHHFHLEGCMLPVLAELETPLGNLQVDTTVVEELQQSKLFRKLPPQRDEDEHSLELQYPYIRHVTEGRDITVVPILVGEITPVSAQKYAAVLLPYLKDADNFFVISSDFCHWGSNFRFQPYDKKHGEIWQSITALDHQGMKIIEALDLEGFFAYLDDTENTICGRNPILLFVATVLLFNKEGKGKAATVTGSDAKAREVESGSVATSENKTDEAGSSKLSFTFLDYTQSNKVKSKSDMSVSYASGVAYDAAVEKPKKTVLGDTTNATSD